MEIALLFLRQFSTRLLLHPRNNADEADDLADTLAQKINSYLFTLVIRRPNCWYILVDVCVFVREEKATTKRGESKFKFNLNANENLTGDNKKKGGVTFFGAVWGWTLIEV